MLDAARVCGAHLGSLGHCPMRYATKARVTRDPRDAIDRQFAIDHPRGVCFCWIHGADADHCQKKPATIR